MQQRHSEAHHRLEEAQTLVGQAIDIFRDAPPPTLNGPAQLVDEPAPAPTTSAAGDESAPTDGAPAGTESAPTDAAAADEPAHASSTSAGGDTETPSAG